MYPWIAKTRHSTPGVGLISPPPHHDIYSIEDLEQLIHDLKNANPRARVHVKLVAEVGVGTVAAGVSKAHADVVLISGHDGGTGASPLTSLKHAGAPWELGLAETQQTLLLNGLRDRIVVQIDGQMKTGRDVVIAALLGAEEFGFATAPLVVSGCVMMRVCHLDTCPVGVATQNPELRQRFTGKPEFVVNFFEFIAEEVRELLAELGFRTLAEAVGHVEVLDTRAAVDHWKARGLDLTPILARARAAPTARRCYQHGRAGPRPRPGARRRSSSSRAAPALERRAAGAASRCRSATSTAPSARCSAHEVTRRYGGDGPARRHDRHHLRGLGRAELRRLRAAGHHAAPRGRRQRLRRQGPLGRADRRATPTVTRRSSPRRTSSPATSSLYGATGGEVFLRGVVGERFCVRNSGATAVVEGVGDHGCEYMTGGRVVVLGADRPQLRRRHVGRHRLRATTPTARSRRSSTPRWSTLEPLDDDDRDFAARPRRAPPRRDRLGGRPRACSTTGTSSVATSARSCRRDYKRVLEAISGQAEESTALDVERGDAWPSGSMAAEPHG